MQGVIKRPIDGSTNVFWKHFKVVHRRLYDALKGFGDDHGGQQCIITEGADGQLKIEALKKRPMGGGGLTDHFRASLKHKNAGQTKFIKPN